MKGKIKSHVKTIVLFCITLLMFNCQNEEHSSDQLQSKIQTVPVDEAKDFLVYSKGSSSAKSANNELDNIELDKVTQEKIKGSDQLLTVIPFVTNNAFENKRILLLKVDNEIKTVVFSMYPDEDSVRGSFSGKIFSHTLDGSFITGFRAENGIIVSQFVENSNAIKTNTETGKTSSLTRRVQLKEVVVQNNYRNTVHALDMFGSTGMYGDGIFGGGVGNSGGGGYSWDAGGGGISVPTPVQIAIALEKQIDGSQLDPCTRIVLEKLKNLKQNDIASIFEKFGVPVNGTYNLKIILGTPNTPEALANTRPISKNNYLITIRETYVKGTYNNQKSPTDLAVATILIHEIIHAHFLALFDDYHNNGDSCAYDNFDCLYEKYVSKNYVGNIDVQHAQMFDNYMGKMAEMLEEFKPGLSPQLYKDLAMSTMFGLKYFDDRYPDGSMERRRILNNRLAENNNMPSGEVTPKGSPCN